MSILPGACSIVLLTYKSILSPTLPLPTTSRSTSTLYSLSPIYTSTFTIRLLAQSYTTSNCTATFTLPCFYPTCLRSTDSIWHTSTQQQQQAAQQHHWQMTTEPSFITKPRPTGWTKPGIVNLPAPQHRPSKPPKPTKKPIVYERPPPPPTPTSSSTSTSSTTAMQPQPQPQPKPKPKPKPTRPQVCKYVHPFSRFPPRSFVSRIPHSACSRYV